MTAEHQRWCILCLYYKNLGGFSDFWACTHGLAISRLQTRPYLAAKNMVDWRAVLRASHSQLQKLIIFPPPFMLSKGGTRKLKFWSWSVTKKLSLTHLMHFNHIHLHENRNQDPGQNLCGTEHQIEELELHINGLIILSYKEL